MTKWICGTLLTFSSFAMAETKTYYVEKMHCEGCVAGVKEKVCQLENVDKTKCDVKLGEMTISSMDGKTLNDKAISEAVKAAGYEMASAPPAGGNKMACEHGSQACSDKNCNCHKGDHSKGKKSSKKGV